MMCMSGYCARSRAYSRRQYQPLKSKKCFSLSFKTLTPLVMALAMISSASAMGIDPYILNFDDVHAPCDPCLQCTRMRATNDGGEPGNNRSMGSNSASAEINDAICALSTKMGAENDSSGPIRALDPIFEEQVAQLAKKTNGKSKDVLESYLLFFMAQEFYQSGDIVRAELLVTAYGQRYCSGSDAVKAYQVLAEQEMKRGNTNDELRLWFQAGRIAVTAGLDSRIQGIKAHLKERAKEVAATGNSSDFCAIFELARPSLHPVKDRYIEVRDPKHPMHEFIEGCK